MPSEFHFDIRIISAGFGCSLISEGSGKLSSILLVSTNLSTRALQGVKFASFDSSDVNTLKADQGYQAGLLKF